MLRLCASAVLIFCAHSLFGGVVLDGSFGTSGALPGPNFMIPANVGKQVGGNLFQSFGQFNLISSESATFTGPNNVQNILARVTSGTSSSIDGKVSSQIQGANLFFLNPAGVVFGPHAQLDVSGSFAVTTANYVKMVGGGRFNANLGGQDTLTSAPVSAFGFLNSTPAGVSVTGSTLNIAPQKSFSVVAGDIGMNGGIITGGSRANLVSVRSAGEAQLDPGDIHSAIDVTQFTALGEIDLTNSTQIDMSGPAGGAVVIRGGDLTMDNSKIAVGAMNAGDGVDVKMDTSVGLTNQSSIEATAFSDFANITVVSISAPTISIAGFSSIASLGGGGVNAGNLSVTADQLMLTDGGQLAANTSDAGKGGDISVNARDIMIRDEGSGIGASTTDIGAGGNIYLSTQHLAIDAGGIVQTPTFGPGPSGSVRVDAANVSITGDGGTLQTGIIAGDTLGGDGPAGSVQLNVTGQLMLTNGARVSSDNFGAATGGDVVIAAQNLTIVDGGVIQSSTSGPGAGGSVRVNAATVSITGDFGQSQVSADAMPGSQGNAGSVQLNITGQLTIAGTAQVSSDTFGAGAGGNVIIAAQSAIVDGRGLVGGFTAISTQSQDPVFGGPAGNIVLNIRDTLQLLSGGQVGAFTIGPGAGGRIDVNAVRVFISGEGAALTGITASTESEMAGGPGGDIQLNLTGSLEIVAGGEISVSTSGSGAGGSVSIAAPLVSISGVSSLGTRSSISATTLSGLNGGRGGNIMITANSLQGSGGGEISASTAGSGAGGSIDIRAHVLSLNDFTIHADTISPDTAPVPVRVSQLNVSLDIDFSFDQDLTALLVGPDLTTVYLFGGVGGNGQHFHNTVLADDAPISIMQGMAPFTGRFQPLSPLAALDGRIFGQTARSSGQWVLMLIDPNRNVGSLNSWSLTTGGITVTSTDTPISLPNPDGSQNIVSNIFVGVLPPAAIVPIVPGNGGDVHIHADTLNMFGAASISAKSTGAGASGSVQLNARNVRLDSHSSVASSNIGTGNAGSVSVNANGDITLLGGSSITTSAAGADAGVIDIASGGAIRLRDQSSITASAGTNGGNIKITAPNLFYSLDSKITATAGTSVGGGTGGNITIDPQFIVLNNSLISANATVGQGGNINLLSNFFFDSASLITATGTTNGTINISAPELDLGAELIALPSSLVNAENQLRERCTALLQGDFSSFISIGRGGTEPVPEELQSEF